MAIYISYALKSPMPDKGRTEGTDKDRQSRDRQAGGERGRVADTGAAGHAH